MAWKPWYERMAEIDSAQEREEFMRGVFGMNTTSKRDFVGPALISLMAGFGLGLATRRPKK